MSDVEGGSVLGNDGSICQAAKIREEHSELRVHVKKNRIVGQAIVKIRNEAPYLGNQRDGSWVGVGTREDQNASAAGLTAYIPLIRRNILNSLTKWLTLPLTKSPSGIDNWRIGRCAPADVVGEVLAERNSIGGGAPCVSSS